jgi:hypothetical protein
MLSSVGSSPAAVYTERFRSPRVCDPLKEGTVLRVYYRTLSQQFLPRHFCSPASPADRHAESRCSRKLKYPHLAWLCMPEG